MFLKKLKKISITLITIRENVKLWLTVAGLTLTGKFAYIEWGQGLTLDIFLLCFFVFPPIMSDKSMSKVKP